MKVHLTALTCAILLAPTAFADAKETAKSTAENALTAGYDLVDKEVVTLSFDKGESKLSTADEASLKALLTSFEKEAKLDKVMVGVYSDKEFPATGELTEADKKLADARAESVEKALKNYGADNVEVFKMTDKPNWFEKTFNMDEAKVKEAMKKPEQALRDKEDRYMAAVGRAFLSKGGPSKVVVIAKPEVEKISH